MSFKSKLKSMRKPYGNRQTGTYQTRDTSCNQHVSSPKVVHEEVTPDNPFNPLINHQGAPVYDPTDNDPQAPVSSASADDNTDTTTTDEGTDINVNVHLEPWEEQLCVGCAYIIVGVIVMAIVAFLFYMAKPLF